MKNKCRKVIPGLRFLVRCLAIVFLLAILSVQSALAAKKEEVINTSPDSNTAGLVNTELVPENSYQADFTTGHVWYGATDRTNIFTNAYANALLLGGIPSLSLGGKHRYCETAQLSCSMLAEFFVGLKLTGAKSRYLASLLQHSVAIDFDTSGRLIFGLGAALYAERNLEIGLSGFEDRFFSWMNLFYDFPLASDWSLGAGFSPALKTVRHFHEKLAESLDFYVNRIGLAGGSVFHIRTQYSFGDWQLSGGGGLMSAGGNWSLWPVAEVIWKKPESLFMSVGEDKK